MSDDDVTTSRPDPLQFPVSRDNWQQLHDVASSNAECEGCGGVVLEAVRSLERRVRSLAAQTARLRRHRRSCAAVRSQVTLHHPPSCLCSLCLSVCVSATVTTCRLLQVNSALHPSGVAKSSTSFGWGRSGNVTSVGWQVTLCDPIWYVSSRSGDGRSACKLLYVYFTATATTTTFYNYNYDDAAHTGLMTTDCCCSVSRSLLSVHVHTAVSSEMKQGDQQRDAHYMQCRLAYRLVTIMISMPPCNYN